MSVAENFRTIKGDLPSGCKLIAVTKTHPVEVILEAYNAGHRLFGENKVQEMLPKHGSMPKDIEWHLIGHLQTNKVRYIAPFISLIHSVDSYRLLQEINKQGEKIKRQISCLLQVHIAEEESKFGLSEEEVLAIIAERGIEGSSWVRIEGLMGMATLTADKDQIRKEFRKLRAFFEKLTLMNLPSNVKMNDLSMGMSDDYRIALEEGSTMIRVGSAIFGQRQYNR